MKPLISLAAVFLAVGASPARAVDIVFDYSYDSSGFFSSDKRVVLDQVAQVFSRNLNDTLNAITPFGDNVLDVRLFDPQNPSNLLLMSDFSVPADTVRIFVGSKSLGALTLGMGGPGSIVASGSSGFIENAISRGEPGALDEPPSDFAPWGGTITFSTDTSWYFDSDVSTVEGLSGKFDFYTVAMHETAHVLGVGTSDTWFARVDTVQHTFSGTLTRSLEGGVPVKLQSDNAHFSTTVRGLANGVEQMPLLAPTITAGARKYMTDLDWAALHDIGWEVASLNATIPSPVPEPATWAMMIGGALLVGSAARRRR